MRHAYEPIPWLGAGQAPKVSAVTGLGALASGAGVFTQDGAGFGVIIVQPGHSVLGRNPPVAGSITLLFAAPPPTLFFTADEDFGPLTVTGQGTTSVTVSWTQGTLKRQRRSRINYEWAVSQ